MCHTGKSFLRVALQSWRANTGAVLQSHKWVISEGIQLHKKLGRFLRFPQNKAACASSR